jgi:hypothetical protein
MGMFDAELAARQISFYTDVVRRLDTADHAALARDDPTLGQDGGADEERAYRTRARQYSGVAMTVHS